MSFFGVSTEDWAVTLLETWRLAITIATAFLLWTGFKLKNGWHPPPIKKRRPGRRAGRPGRRKK